MTQSLLLAIAATLLGTFLPATDSTAAVFSRDWQTPGDGLLTYDDVNQREWLDLPVSLLVQYPGTLEQRYQAVVTETLLGGEFEGFTPAISADVIALAQSAGIDTGTLDYPTNVTSTETLIALLGVTFISRERQYAMGLLETIRILALVKTPYSLMILGLSARVAHGGFWNAISHATPQIVPFGPDRRAVVADRTVASQRRI